MCTVSACWTGADICAYDIFCVVWAISYHHFPFPLTSPPHYTSCLHHWLSLSASNNTCVIHIGLDIHFWQGEAWSHSQSLAATDEVLLTWIKPVSCCDGCLSHRSIPSLLTWYDGRWYSTSARWALMLAGASSATRPWQTTLYSFNPKVLKQHLTKIEVGFVIEEEEGKKWLMGNVGRKDFQLYTLTLRMMMVCRMYSLIPAIHTCTFLNGQTLHLHFDAGTAGRRGSIIGPVGQTW